MQIDPGFRKFQFKEEKWSPEYYEYRRKWEEQPKTGVIGEYPLNLDVEVTNDCNLRCAFCVREQMSGPIGYMGKDMFKEICREIDGKVPAMKLNWRGEPTLHEDLADFVRMAKKAGVIEVMINTNGTLDYRTATDLVTFGIDRIIFSIDSIDEETYESQRVGADFHQVINALSSLHAFRKAFSRNGKPYIRVQKIDLPETRNEKYVEYFAGMGVDTVAINSYKEKDADLIEPEWEPLQCAQPFQRLVISWDGYFYPCCQGNTFKPIGNIKDMTIKEAWNSGLMNELRKSHKEGRQKEWSQCRSCETTKPVGDTE